MAGHMDHPSNKCVLGKIAIRAGCFPPLAMPIGGSLGMLNVCKALANSDTQARIANQIVHRHAKVHKFHKVHKVHKQFESGKQVLF